MTELLRPMNLGEIFDRTFQIYRSRFLAFVAILAIPVLAMELADVVNRAWPHPQSLFHPSGRPGAFMWSFAVGLGYYPLACVLFLLIEPALVKLASRSILGEECSIAFSLRFVGARWRDYLWIGFLMMIACLVIPGLVYVGLAVGTNASGLLARESRLVIQLATIIFKLVGWILFLWMVACLSLAIPVSALENLVGLKALRRSWVLTKGTRARICFIALAVYASLWALTWVQQVSLGQLLYFIGGALHLADAMRNLYGPGNYVLGMAIYAMIGPIFPIAITLFYYDQRIRREGYDIERMMHEAGLIASAPPPVGESPIAPVPSVQEEGQR
jgi:hypothetical protein